MLLIYCVNSKYLFILTINHIATKLRGDITIQLILNILYIQLENSIFFLVTQLKKIKI